MPSMRDEIQQQPAVLTNLVSQERQTVEDIADRIRSRDICYVVIAARGSSDNAARYGKYLFGSLLGLQVALATPSLFTLYHRPPDFQGACVIGISQSGQSEDVVSVLREGRRQGVPTLGITNHPDSPLAQHSDHVLNLRAGDEKAVAATKTYTAQLVALAMLATAWLEDGIRQQELAFIPDALEATLRLEQEIEDAVGTYVDATHGVVVGRGYNYSTAFEIALKLKETCNLAVEPFSPADFLHGPIALVKSGYPAIVVAPSGAAFDNLLSFSRELRDKGASLLVVSDRSAALELADVPLELPVSVPEWLSPVVCVVPGQMLALHLALARGLDPDQPPALKKITITR